VNKLINQLTKKLQNAIIFMPSIIADRKLTIA